MNEPSVFSGPEKTLPKTVVHHINKTATVMHRDVHNTYGLMSHKATYEGALLREGSENIRPFVLSRSFFFGSQKYGPIWTGDNLSTWDFLRTSIS